MKVEATAFRIQAGYVMTSTIINSHTAQTNVLLYRPKVIFKEEHPLQVSVKTRQADNDWKVVTMAH